MNAGPNDFALACPVCQRPLESRSDRVLRCPGDGAELVFDSGIWRAPADGRNAGAGRFLADYRRLRRDEGWGSGDDAYYSELPFRDVTGRHDEIWRIRAASYRLLCSRVLKGNHRRVADLGAGNCWLSWRLAEAGHMVAAVDLSDDAGDGLGAAGRYPGTAGFLRLQASFDRVPLAGGELDLAIFNGSLHYSTDAGRTLVEARRLLRRGGRVVIMDSPVYRSAESGECMLEERREQWQRRYGPDFGALPAQGFFTRRRLRRLGDRFGIGWRIQPLPLGWRWRLAPLAARVRGRREPARFPLIVSRPIE